MKKVLIFLSLLVLTLALTSCGSNRSSSNSNGSGTPTSNSSQTYASAPSSASWPAHMKDLPVPKGTISGVEKYVGMKHLAKDDTTPPDLVIVEVTDMAKEDAQDYVKQLKSLGFSNGMDTISDEKIVFSGVATNSAAKNGVNFLYNISTKTATISY